MLTVLTKRYLCTLCKKNEILHQCDEEMLDERSVPDQSNCDFSHYSNSRVTGGRLLWNRQRAKVESVLPRTNGKEKLPIGGVCHTCLAREDVVKLISAQAIRFEDQPETFHRY